MAEWSAFERDEDIGKTVLHESGEADDGVFLRAVPDGDELDGKFVVR